jgi:hypothetical protein
LRCGRTYRLQQWCPGHASCTRRCCLLCPPPIAPQIPSFPCLNTCGRHPNGRCLCRVLSRGECRQTDRDSRAQEHLRGPWLGGWPAGQAAVCSQARMGLKCIGVEFFAKNLGGPRPGLAPTELRQCSWPVRSIHHQHPKEIEESGRVVRAVHAPPCPSTLAKIVPHIWSRVTANQPPLKIRIEGHRHLQIYRHGIRAAGGLDPQSAQLYRG